MLLRHVGGKPDEGMRPDRDIQITAVVGRLYVANSYAAAGCDAVVLEPGGFWIRRTFFERVLRSFHEKEIIVLEVSEKRLTIGKFSCSILGYEAAPDLPKVFEFVPHAESNFRSGAAK